MNLLSPEMCELIYFSLFLSVWVYNCLNIDSFITFSLALFLYVVLKISNFHTVTKLKHLCYSFCIYKCQIELMQFSFGLEYSLRRTPFFHAKTKNKIEPEKLFSIYINSVAVCSTFVYTCVLLYGSYYINAVACCYYLYCCWLEIFTF